MTTQRQEAWITSRFTVPTSSHSVYSNSNRHEVVVVDPSPISIVGVNEPITVERLESSLAKGIATEVKTQLQPLNEKITQQDQKITQQDQRITKQQQEILELNKQLAETKQKELQQEWVQMFCDVFSAYKDKIIVPLLQQKFSGSKCQLILRDQEIKKHQAQGLDLTEAKIAASLTVSKVKLNEFCNSVRAEKDKNGPFHSLFFEVLTAGGMSREQWEAVEEVAQERNHIHQKWGTQKQLTALVNKAAQQLPLASDASSPLFDVKDVYSLLLQLLGSRTGPRAVASVKPVAPVIVSPTPVPSTPAPQSPMPSASPSLSSSSSSLSASFFPISPSPSASPTFPSSSSAVSSSPMNLS